MATGVHAEKSADVFLPLLFLIGTVSDWATTIDGLVFVVRFFLLQVGPKGNVRFEAAYHLTAEGDEFGYIRLDMPGDRDPDAAIRAALSPLRRKSGRRKR